MISSPFLRCLQTASRVSCELEKKPIKVDYILSEQLDFVGDDISDPIGTLTIRTRDKSEIKKEGLNDIDFIDKDKYMTEIKQAASVYEFSDFDEEFDTRVKNIVAMLVQKHKKRNDGKNIVYVIVTHAPVVYQTLPTICKTAKEGTQKISFPDYCGSFEILITGQEEIYVKKGINDDYI